MLSIDSFVWICVGSESNRRVAELLRISREKVAQQQKIGAQSDDKRKKKKKKKKKKGFPSEWVMKFAKNVRFPHVRHYDLTNPVASN